MHRCRKIVRLDIDRAVHRVQYSIPENCGIGARGVVLELIARLHVAVSVTGLSRDLPHAENSNPCYSLVSAMQYLLSLLMLAYHGLLDPTKRYHVVSDRV